MKELSISVQTAGWLNPMFGEDKSAEAFEFIKKCGFESLDYNIDTKLIPKQIDKNDRGTFFTKSVDEILEYYAPIKEALDKSGISMTQAHAPFPLFRRSSEEMSDFLIEALEKCLVACKFLGIPAIVTHPCNYIDRENEKRCNLALFRRIIPIAKKYGVKICLENVPNVTAGHVIAGTCCDVNEANWYIDMFNEEAGEDIFGFCFDIGHANISSTNMYDYITKLGSRLTVLHLHDNDAVSDQHLAPMTQKKTDWDGFIEGLRDINYRGPINFESCKSIMQYPSDLIPAMLTYTAEVGKYIRKRVLEK